MKHGTDDRVLATTVFILAAFLTFVGFALELAGVSATGAVVGLLLIGLPAPFAAQRAARWLVSRRDG